MSIILNETAWAKEALVNKDLGKSPFETLRRVARYFLDTGLSRAQTQSAVSEFVVSCDPSASIVKWGSLIESAVSFASKHDAVNLDYVVVTDAELKRIDSLDTGSQSQRLAFTLLCLAKYWNVCNGETNWVNSKDADIMRMANIKTSIKRQCKLYHDLREAGLISFSKKIDCTNVRVDFVDGQSAAAMEISDFRNLGNQYLAHLGEPFFKCAECGVVTRIASPLHGQKQKYCPDCAAVVQARQRIEHRISKRTTTAV